MGRLPLNHLLRRIRLCFKVILERSVPLFKFPLPLCEQNMFDPITPLSKGRNRKRCKVQEKAVSRFWLGVDILTKDLLTFPRQK